MKSKKAAVLAIGTELTQGQITNRNAAWISERLTHAGIEVAFHAVVADDRAEIRSALELCATKAELLVVTGGLGPTSDDFTREVLAEWIDAPLEFREASWEKIVQRLSAFGVEVSPTNRQQCYFPAGAVVLENLEGTADAFRFTRGRDEDRTEVLVLPGPPREGMHVWDTQVAAWIRERFAAGAPARLEIWKCIGKSEASLGEIVEATVRGFDVKTGYRAHAPYVEVKVWFPETLGRGRELELLSKLNAELAPYSVARNEEDLGTKLLDALATHTGTLSLTFLDLGTQGVLSERLHGIFKTPKGRELQSRVEIMTRYGNSGGPEGLPESASEWLFALFPEGKAAILGPEGRAVRDLPNPYARASAEAAKGDGVGDRLRRFHAELALKAWAELLISAQGH
jgi:molybdenum cofactor synthesis domain-containing protein